MEPSQFGPYALAAVVGAVVPLVIKWLDRSERRETTAIETLKAQVAELKIEVKELKAENAKCEERADKQAERIQEQCERIEELERKLDHPR
jgi:predicted nuclease with TOPRIM domain